MRRARKSRLNDKQREATAELFLEIAKAVLLAIVIGAIFPDIGGVTVEVGGVIIGVLIAAVSYSIAIVILRGVKT